MANRGTSLIRNAHPPRKQKPCGNLAGGGVHLAGGLSFVDAQHERAELLLLLRRACDPPLCTSRGAHTLRQSKSPSIHPKAIRQSKSPSIHPKAVRLFTLRQSAASARQTPPSSASSLRSAALHSGSEAGSFLRLIDSCITQLKAQGPSRTCNESKEEEKTTLQVQVLLAACSSTTRKACTVLAIS